MDDPSVGPKIPQALEKILQLKESRQEEMNSQQGECVVSYGLQGQRGCGRVCILPSLPQGGFERETALGKEELLRASGRVPVWGV